MLIRKKVIVQIYLHQILKESSVLYLYFERSIIFIFNVLVKRNAISGH